MAINHHPPIVQESADSISGNIPSSSYWQQQQ